MVLRISNIHEEGIVKHLWAVSFRIFMCNVCGIISVGGKLPTIKTPGQKNIYNTVPKTLEYLVWNRKWVCVITFKVDYYVM